VLFHRGAAPDEGVLRFLGKTLGSMTAAPHDTKSEVDYSGFA